MRAGNDASPIISSGIAAAQKNYPCPITETAPDTWPGVPDGRTSWYHVCPPIESGWTWGWRHVETNGQFLYQRTDYYQDNQGIHCTTPGSNTPWSLTRQFFYLCDSEPSAPL